MNIEKLIKKIKNTQDPINIGKVEDLSDFLEIFSDGNFSDRGFKYYYNPQTHQLLLYKWSRWQGESSYYTKAELKDYLTDLLECRDDSHFKRYINGLKKILRYL